MIPREFDERPSLFGLVAVPRCSGTAARRRYATETDRGYRLNGGPEPCGHRLEARPVGDGFAKDDPAYICPRCDTADPRDTSLSEELNGGT